MAETIETLFARAGLRIERIVSRGDTSPPGFWYDQDWGEWVIVLAGAADLLIDGENSARRLGPGDSLDLPAHQRHRVEWTSDNPPTVWLVVHYPPDA